jgi:hypothetical protein
MKRLVLMQILIIGLLCGCANAQNNEWNPKRTWVFFAGLLEWQDNKFGAFPQKNRRDEVLLNVLRQRGVPENQILYLKDSQATTARIKSEFAAFLKKPKAGDTVFVYFCGHGYKSKDHKNTFLASYDAGVNEGWKVEDIPEAIEQNFKGSMAILTLDNCYSGALNEAVKARKSNISYAVLTSSHFNSFSTGNWTFTESLIYAFRGDAFIDDNHDGKVTLDELESNSKDDMAFAEEQLAQFDFTNGLNRQFVVANAKPLTSKRIGERVEVKSGNKWWTGFIIDEKEGKYRIRYYGFEESDDEWVTTEQIRQKQPKQYNTKLPK